LKSLQPTEKKMTAQCKLLPRSRCLWFKKICYRKGIFWQSKPQKEAKCLYNEAKFRLVCTK
jgi:hypothetical protein